MLLTNKIWQSVSVFDGEDTDALVDVLLESRGIVTHEQKEAFAQNKPEIWHDPFLFVDMQKAVDIIVDSMNKGEKILVYGDYDCDGVTATSILVRYFRYHGTPVDYIVPHRSEHGYGLTENIIDKVYAAKPDLVITVDCGITNIDTVAELKSKGIKVIVTDHHNVKDEIPVADAVICAKRMDNTYPFKDLCGAGVAMKLVEALGRDGRRKVSKSIWHQAIELSGIATIADLVSVTDENRTLIKKAFDCMQEPTNPGVRIMNEMLTEGGKKLDETFISFNFVPRINAAGRLYDSSDSLKLFLEDDDAKVLEAAKALTKANDERKEIEARVFEEAVKQVESPNRAPEWQLTNLKGPIVVYGANWHQGVLGIVAGKLSQYFRRTAIVFTRDSIEEENFKGSGRAYGEDDLYSELEKISDTLVNFGGHKKAAGMVVARSNMSAFMRALEANAVKNLEESKEDKNADDDDNILKIDAMIPYRLIDFATYEKVCVLKPFGIGNKKPVFATENLIISEIAGMGANNDHMRLELVDGNKDYDGSISAVGFGKGDFMNLLKVGDRVDIAYTLNEYSFRGGKVTLSLHLEDIRPRMGDNLLWTKPDIAENLYKQNMPLTQIIKMCKGATIEDMLPGEAHFGVCYKILSKVCQNEMSTFDMNLLAKLLSTNADMIFTPFMVKRCLEAFAEIGLIKLGEVDANRVCFNMLNAKPTKRVSETDTYRRLSSYGT